MTFNSTQGRNVGTGNAEFYSTHINISVRPDSDIAQKTTSLDLNDFKQELNNNHNSDVTLYMSSSNGEKLSSTTANIVNNGDCRGNSENELVGIDGLRFADSILTEIERQ